MAESFSVKAILSAQDSGFSSTLKSASSVIGNLKSTITSGIGFGILQGVGQAAFGAIKNSASELIGEINSSNKAWKTFDGNMKILGKGKKEINSVKKTLQEYAQTTIYSSSDMASSYAQLAAVGIKSADKLVTGFGGLAGAAENPAQAMKTLSQQGVQMAAKPKVAWQDFKLMLEQTPAGIAAVAKQMGMTTSELVTAVQDGKVKTNDFFDAIQKVGNSDGFTKLATEYKSVDQAMDGLKETLGNKLMPAFDALSKGGIGAISGIIDKLDGIDGNKIAEKVTAGIETAKKYWDTFTSSFSGVGSSIMTAFNAVKSGVETAVGAFTNGQTPLENFQSICEGVAGAIKTVSDFIAEHAQTLLNLGKIVVGVVAGYKAFNVIKSINPFSAFGKNAKVGTESAVDAVSGSKSKIAQIITSLGDVIRSAGTAIGTVVKSIGTGIATVFKGIGTALKIANPVNILALGAAIGIVTLAFTALATQGEGVAVIIESIGTAFSIVATAIGSAASVIIDAFANALVTLAPVFPTIAQSLVMLTPLVHALGGVFSSVVTAISNAASSIITAITPIVEIISTAFTTAVEIVANAITQIVSVLAPYIPSITQMVEATMQAVSAVCDAFTTLVQQIVPVIESVTELISQLGTSISEILTAAGDVVSSVGEAISNVITSIGDAISGVLDSLAGVMDSIGNAALNAGTGFKSLADGIKTIVDLPILDLGASLGAVATGIGGISLAAGGIGVAGAGMVTFAAGLLIVVQNGLQVAAILPVIASTLDGLPSSSTSAAAGMLALVPSCTACAAALATLGAAIVTLMSAITYAFDNTADKAQSAGQKVGNNFDKGMQPGLKSAANNAKSQTNNIINNLKNGESKAKSAGTNTGNNYKSGLQSGLNSAVSAARSGVSNVTSTLYTGYSGAYSAGAYIGAGFANGMLSYLSTIRSAAAQMAAAADAAVRAKAKIHSPSKVAKKLGDYYGIGYAKGIDGTINDVWKSAENLVAIPHIAAPDFSGTYNGEMSEDYEYYRNAEYIFTIPFDIDGREVARATVKYSQDELDRLRVRENRKSGKV